MKSKLRLVKDDDGVVFLCDQSDMAILWIDVDGEIVICEDLTRKVGDKYYYTPVFELDAIEGEIE